ncbi:MAG: amidohydrolase family protein [Acidobacteriota bacterium]
MDENLSLGGAGRGLALILITILLGPVGCGTGRSPRFEVVLNGGRVMDPAGGLDGIRSIGVSGGVIRAVSENPLQGDRIIDASGLVVAPGFIDLHVHGQFEEMYRLQALDGVTTSLELEVGVDDVDRWYREHEGKALIHYGVSAGHIPVRMAVFQDPGQFLPSGAAAQQPAKAAQVEEMAQRLEEGLKAGAVAVGFGWAYTPAATMEEIVTMIGVAARYGASTHMHIGGGDDREAALERALEAAERGGGALHVVHINSSGGSSTRHLLERVGTAREQGRDVTTECYPYRAGMTRIESALFDDWKSWPESEFDRFQWVETGERLRRESFGRYRKQGGEVIFHSNPEEVVAAAVEHPLTMIASDGFLVNGRGHPRSAGTFARVLGHYVREKGSLSLMDALGKMTVQPARRLERRVPAMGKKGRIEVGADADLVVFDPQRIRDRATYSDPTLPSEGVQYLLVGGVAVVAEGKLVEGIHPGRPVRAPLGAP